MLRAARDTLLSLACAIARRGRRMRGEERGVSAIEFALIAPALVVLMGGAFEFSGAITASNRATFVADAVAEMVSRSDHTLTQAELKNFAVASALIDTDIVKYARLANKDVEQSFNVTISSVQFDTVLLSCLLGCKYTAKTVFSYTLNGTKRPCGALTASSSQSSATNALPADVFGPGSLVVVDVEVFYKPLMPVRLDKVMPLSFKRSSYFRPRYVSRINSDNNCSGY